MKIGNMEASEHPKKIIEIGECFLELLGTTDWRWTQLKNEIDRPNNLLWRSLYSWILKKV